MKIVIAADIFPPDIGGPATYSENLARELKKNGHNISVVCYGEKSEKNENDGYKIYKIGRGKPLFFRYIDYLKILLEVGKGASLIYAQGPVSAGLPTMLAAKILRKKYIIKVVGDYAWEQGRGRFGLNDGIDEFQNKKYNLKIELFRFVQKSVAKNAAAVITPSYYLKKIVEGWGVRGDNIKVIYNAVNFDDVHMIDKKKAQDKITAPPSVIPAKAGIQKIIFSIARLVPWKGFEMLIKIWPEVIKQDTDLKLVIAGDGPEEDNLRRLVRENKLEDKVFLVGRVEHKKLSDYFSAAEMFVLNSGYEGLSHVLIEAMAHKVPIIASDKGGNIEVIKNNENGIIAEYNSEKDWQEAILKLAEDKGLKEKFIANSLADLGKFKYETMINNTLKFLDDMIK